MASHLNMTEYRDYILCGLMDDVSVISSESLHILNEMANVILALELNDALLGPCVLSGFFLQHWKKNNNIVLNESLEMLVIDEADLLLSFGYQNEMNSLIK